MFPYTWSSAVMVLAHYGLLVFNYGTTKPMLNVTERLEKWATLRFELQRIALCEGPVYEPEGDHIAQLMRAGVHAVRAGRIAIARNGPQTITTAVPVKSYQDERSGFDWQQLCGRSRSLDDCTFASLCHFAAVRVLHGLAAECSDTLCSGTFLRADDEVITELQSAILEALSKVDKLVGMLEQCSTEKVSPREIKCDWLQGYVRELADSNQSYINPEWGPKLDLLDAGEQVLFVLTDVRGEF